MPAHKTPAFVLKTQDYRDTSLLATFYTRDFGKLRAIVKGLRDPKYRYGSTLEPFSLNEIMVYQRRRGDLHLVTGAELTDRFDPLRRDLHKLGAATYMLEIVDQLTDTGEANEEVYGLLGETFAALARSRDPELSVRLFEIKFMKNLGFMPELDSCVRCSKPRSGDAAFSVPSGGIVCVNCRKGEGPLVPASAATLDFLEAARTCSYESLSATVLAPADRAKLDRLMRQFVDEHLSSKPKSLSFLEKINSALFLSFPRPPRRIRPLAERRESDPRLREDDLISRN